MIRIRVCIYRGPDPLDDDLEFTIRILFPERGLFRKRKKFIAPAVVQDFGFTRSSDFQRKNIRKCLKEILSTFAGAHGEPVAWFQIEIVNKVLNTQPVHPVINEVIKELKP